MSDKDLLKYAGWLGHTYALIVDSTGKDEPRYVAMECNSQADAEREIKAMKYRHPVIYRKQTGAGLGWRKVGRAGKETL